MTKINVLNRNVEITNKDYISLTDIARYKNSATGLVISHWMSTKYTIEFMGLWEKCIILILMLLNSVTLKIIQVQTDLFFQVLNG